MKARWMMAAVMLAMIAATAAAAEEKPVSLVPKAPAASSEPLHWHDLDTCWMRQFRNPMEGVEMGLDLRLREVFGHNILSLNDQWGDDQGANAGNWNNYHWQRYRTRLSTKVALTDDVTFNSRLTWEFWGHVQPEGGYHPINGKEPFMAEHNYDFDEAIFDIMMSSFEMPLICL
jgi:hypothetical protein